jgi:hypothetical protein
MKKAIVVTTCLLSGCSADKPGHEELFGALNGLGQKKACITSALFDKWPARGDSVIRNKDIMERLVDVGLISKVNDAFDLTVKGIEFFDKEQNGFCYASGHTVSDVNLVKEIPKEQLPEGVYGAWQVSFKVTPMVAGEWIDDDALLKKLGVEFLAITQSQEFTARVIKRSETSKVELSDPRFSYSPNHSFSLVW